MEVRVCVVGKHDWINKVGKQSYCVELVDYDNHRVYKAYTVKKHYDSINGNEPLKEIKGYVTFENGYTKFFLPKEVVIE